MSSQYKQHAQRQARPIHLQLLTNPRSQIISSLQRTPTLRRGAVSFRSPCSIHSWCKWDNRGVNMTSVDQRSWARNNVCEGYTVTVYRARRLCSQILLLLLFAANPITTMSTSAPTWKCHCLHGDVAAKPPSLPPLPAPQTHDWHTHMEQAKIPFLPHCPVCLNEFRSAAVSDYQTAFQHPGDANLSY